MAERHAGAHDWSVETLRDSEPARVIAYRAVRLQPFFPPGRALQLAENPLVDVHELEHLIAAGATAEQAANLAEHERA